MFSKILTEDVIPEKSRPMEFYIKFCLWLLHVNTDLRICGKTKKYIVLCRVLAIEIQIEMCWQNNL